MARQRQQLGGVPKLAIHEALVSDLGLAGDAHRFPDIHGGPERALCLFSVERILELQAEGHPIFPGSVGENVTISGLDWEQINPGIRLALGDEVVVEIASFRFGIGQHFLDFPKPLLGLGREHRVDAQPARASCA